MFGAVGAHCPVCYDKFLSAHVPKMVAVSPPPAPPVPPGPKPTLSGELRYATVMFEPLNPRFKMIRIEHREHDERLWVKPPTVFKTREEIVVLPNPDTLLGGWVQAPKKP